MAVVCALAAGCSDQQDSPTASAIPADQAPALTGRPGGKGKSSLDLIGDDYAGGLLGKSNANRYREYAVSRPDKLPSKYRSTEKGKDATYSWC